MVIPFHANRREFVKPLWVACWDDNDAVSASQQQLGSSRNSTSSDTAASASGRSDDAHRSTNATVAVSENNVSMGSVNQVPLTKGILWWSSTEASDNDLYVTAKARRPKKPLLFNESDVAGIREFNKDNNSKTWKDLDVQSFLSGN